MGRLCADHDAVALMEAKDAILIKGYLQRAAGHDAKFVVAVDGAHAVGGEPRKGQDIQLKVRILLQDGFKGEGISEAVDKGAVGGGCAVGIPRLCSSACGGSLGGAFCLPGSKMINHSKV